MPDRTQEARGRRSQARERRRSRVSQPGEEHDETARSTDSEARPGTDGNFAGAAAKVVGTAFAAGMLGALGGAAKAMFERNVAGRGKPETERAPKPEVSGEPPASDEEQYEPVDVSRDDAEPETEERGQIEQPRGSSTDADAERDAEVSGLSDDDAAEIVSTARRHLEAMLRTDVERVSGLESVDGHWSVTLEVVEVARIPESTDVLATYEVGLDDDGGLLSVSRVRRYRRSQVEEDV